MRRRAAIYCRVSTKRQADSDISIPDQLNQCRGWCEAEGYDVAAEFIEPGASARSDDRPAFQDMIGEACSQGRPFDVIVIHSLSRFTRNETDFHLYKHKLKKKDIRIHSVTQNLAEDANGDLMASIITAFDAHQSAETSKHVSRTMLENAREGFWNGAKPPYGFETFVAETRGKKEKKKLKIHDREAEIVRLVFDLYVEGTGRSGAMGIKKVVNHLNDKGYRTRTGQPFRVQFIGDLLRNSAYIGKHFFNRRDSKAGTVRPREAWVEFPVPRIVDEALFHAAQERLDQNHALKTPPRETNSPVLLTGIAHCGSCGSRMKLQTGKGGKYRYYKCAARADKGKAACKGQSIPEGLLDETVFDSFQDKVLDAGRLRGIVGTLVARASNAKEKLSAEIKTLKVEKRKVETAIQNLYQLVENGIELDATLSARISSLQSEREQCVLLMARKQRQLDAPMSVLSDASIEKFRIALLAQLSGNNDPAFRKAYVREFISHVNVTESEFRITGPKAALLAHSAQLDQNGGKLVPTFAQAWRTREDSNLWPLPSEGSALSS
jgi:site-specific DNA recombinase